MKIIGYARVSSREQAENSHALEQQIARLKAAGATEILSDVESGTKDDRQAFNCLMDLLDNKAIDEVVVTRLDRLTRSLLTLRKAMLDFQISGVNFRALDDSIDLSTAAGKFHLNMLGALAEMEVDRLAERVKHGWQHLRNRKVAMNPPFGYVKVNDRHELDHTPFVCLLEERPEDPKQWGNSEMWGDTAAPSPAVTGRSKSAIAREIVDAYLDKRSLRLALRVIYERYGIQTFANNNQPGKAKGGRVARDLFRFSPPGLSNWLTNPVLQGHVCYLRKKNGRHLKADKWDIHYNTHSEQRLITDEEAKQIQEIAQHNHVVKGFGSTALKYPLSGLVFCGECRGSWYSVCGRKNYNHPERGYNYYFQCKNWRSRACSQKTTIRMEVVEETVIDTLLKRREAIAQIAERPPEHIDPPELKALRAELAYYDNAPGNRAEVIKADLRRQIEVFQSKQGVLTVQESENRELLLQVFGDRSYWKTLLDEEKQEIFRALVERIVLKDGKVEQVILKV
jgi:DNA invertase Pin-like site-specific DNA recombinase